MKRISLSLLTLAIGFIATLNIFADIVAPDSVAGRAIIGTMTSPKVETVSVIFGDTTFTDSLGEYGTYTWAKLDASHCVLTMTQQEPGDNNGDVSTLDLAFKNNFSGGITGQVAFSGGGSKPLKGTFTLDITGPTLTITSPKSGLHLSSGDFTAVGASKDNVSVASVFYQLNGGVWTPASTTNDWKNWSAGNLHLFPGTNTFSAYAVDTSTNYSGTNTVKFEYVVTNTLTVQIVGKGAPAPNYNGKALAINNNFTMKAVPAPGFAFSYWSGGVPMSTNRSLTFTMSTNLVIIANFRYVARPVNVILFPKVNTQSTNSDIIVTGKAHDNAGVSSVWVQINTNDWAEAGTINSFTNWSATNLTVISGANLVRAFAVDAAGNVSLTNSIKFIGVLAPTSLSGYTAVAKPSNSKQGIVMSWGDDTWAQTGTGSDTNANDYCAGSYAYRQTGPHTALLTNIDIGMMSALGTTNVTAVNLTFTSLTAGNYAWSNGTGSGSGTMTFSRVSNLVPASLAGKTLTARNTKIAFAGDGTFTESKAGSLVGYGTYTFTQYSPTVAMLQLNWTDPNDAGAVAYVEMTFASATNINIAQSWYSNPSFGSYPDDWGLATGTIK